MLVKHSQQAGLNTGGMKLSPKQKHALIHLWMRVFLIQTRLKNTDQVSKVC